MNIRDFIPPVILKVKQKLIDKEKAHEELKEYNSFESAQKECVQGDYQNIELCEMIADKTVIYRDLINKTTDTLNSTNVFLLAAINELRANHSLNTMTVLDFGGACGAHYFEIKKLLPATFKLKWIVAETSQMVLAAKAKNIETSELTLVDNLNNLPPIDFIYTSCALHYTSNPYGFLNDLLKVNATAVLFNRMMFNENDRDIITIQKSRLQDNGPGPMPLKYSDKLISYPHTTLSFNKFNSIVSRSYELKWSFNEATGNYKLGNEPIVGRGVFYIRNTATLRET